MHVDNLVLRDVVVKACQGDVCALGTLYGHYYLKMVWLAYSVLLNQDQAEDVAQQCFVVACEKRGPGLVRR